MSANKLRLLYCYYKSIKRQKQKQKQSQNQRTQPLTPQKWCTFTYIGRETSFITKIFKHTSLKIAYRTGNTLQKHLSYNTAQQDKYTKSGIYKLTCPDCNKVLLVRLVIIFTRGMMSTKELSGTTPYSQNMQNM